MQNHVGNPAVTIGSLFGTGQQRTIVSGSRLAFVVNASRLLPKEPVQTVLGVRGLVGLPLGVALPQEEALPPQVQVNPHLQVQVNPHLRLPPQAQVNPHVQAQGNPHLRWMLKWRLELRQSESYN